MKMFMGRQPIFNREKQVFGYEVKLEKDFMSYMNKAAEEQHIEVGQAEHSESKLKFWVDLLRSQHQIFVTIPNLDLLYTLPAKGLDHNVVYGIKGDLNKLEDYIGRVKYLKGRGCLFMLQDMEQVSKGSKYLEYMDLVRLDFNNFTKSDSKPCLSAINKKGLKVLANHVQTYDQFRLALQCGVEYFMGDFFKTPDLSTGRSLYVNQVSHFQLLKEINQPHMRFHRLEGIIERDATLAIKILQFINSSHFGVRFRIRSIQHALTMLGEKEIQKWATLVIISSISKGKPPELLTTALVRARFCEEMAVLSGQKNLKNECFFLGLISVLDAMLDLSMEEVLKRFPLSSIISEALLGMSDNPMSLVLQLIINYEQANWFNLAETAHRLKIEEDVVVQTYFKALEFASEDMGF
ncbi:MAG: hypothetical protein CSA81_10955 [Acidobacteria bacterium]|nr:MAG: hypothetical protein CSA81_10955 [Acidobacteriota bacterium]